MSVRLVFIVVLALLFLGYSSASLADNQAMEQKRFELAIEADDSDIAYHLLKFNPNLDSTFSDNLPLIWACSRGFRKVLKHFLRSDTICWSTENHPALLAAIKEGQVAIIKDFMADGRISLDPLFDEEYALEKLDLPLSKYFAYERMLNMFTKAVLDACIVNNENVLVEADLSRFSDYEIDVLIARSRDSSNVRRLLFKHIVSKSEMNGYRVSGIADILVSRNAKSVREAKKMVKMSKVCEAAGLSLSSVIADPERDTKLVEIVDANTVTYPTTKLLYRSLALAVYFFLAHSSKIFHNEWSVFSRMAPQLVAAYFVLRACFGWEVGKVGGNLPDDIFYVHLLLAICPIVDFFIFYPFLGTDFSYKPQ